MKTKKEKLRGGKNSMTKGSKKFFDAVRLMIETNNSLKEEQGYIAVAKINKH